MSYWPCDFFAWVNRTLLGAWAVQGVRRALRTKLAAAFATVLVIMLAACSASPAADVTASPAPTLALPTARPTATLRPTPTFAPATPPPPNVLLATPTAVVYIVQAGDTLIPIANRYNVSVQDIVAANNNLDATRLQVGQSLIIPVGGPQQPLQDSALLPSPTPVPFQIRGENFFRTAAGSFECLGEVFNPSATPLNNVQLQINLMDDANNVLKTATLYVSLEVIAANGSAPFRVLFTDPPPTISRVEVKPLRGEAIDPAIRYANVQVTKQEGAPAGNQYRVTGEITNQDQFSARKVRLIVTTFDENNRVVGYRYLVLSDDAIPPQQVLPFDVTLTSASPNIARFAVVAEALKVQ
jgi:LysM repeat protein